MSVEVQHAGLGSAYLRSHPDVPITHEMGEACGYCDERHPRRPAGDAMSPTTDEPTTGQGRWLIEHQGLVNISKPAHRSMRGDEIDLRACVVTIEAEAAEQARAALLAEPEAGVGLDRHRSRDLALLCFAGIAILVLLAWVTR